MRILLVEDDAKLVRALERGLTTEGHEVITALTGDDGLARAVEAEHDVVVLDLMLPGMDGFAVCSALRDAGRDVPVLMLTARSGVADRIKGLDGGADDYLVKPFDFGELLARLRVLTRRGPVAAPAVLTIGDLHVDTTTRVVTRAGHQIELTPREYDVLEVLVDHRNTPVSRAELLAAVWSEGFQGSANIVDVYIGYLRRKLETPRGRRLIRTVRGRGFVLEVP
jgi:two-component system, OmpR family, response regulator